MSDTAPAVPIRHNGVDWVIPADLIAVQRAFDAANDECSRLAAEGDQAAYDAARVTRMDAVLALHRHPWLEAARVEGRRYQADTALKEAARDNPLTGADN